MPAAFLSGGRFSDARLGERGRRRRAWLRNAQALYAALETLGQGRPRRNNRLGLLAALDLLHQLLQRLVYGRERIGEAVVGAAAAIVHGDEVAMDRVEALGRARFTLLVTVYEAGGLVRSVAHDLLQLCRCLVETLDQACELSFDAGYAGDLDLCAAKLLSHLGKLPLNVVQMLKLWALAERGVEFGRDVVQAGVEGR